MNISVKVRVYNKVLRTYRAAEDTIAAKLAAVATSQPKSFEELANKAQMAATLIAAQNLLCECCADYIETVNYMEQQER